MLTLEYNSVYIWHFDKEYVTICRCWCVYECVR